jgi:hypothetical protein
MDVEGGVRVETRWLRRGVVTMGLFAALFYANFLLNWQAGGLASFGMVISDQEAPGQPGAMFLRVTDVVCAVLVLAILPYARRALPPGRWCRTAIAMMVLFAIGAISAALIPVPCVQGLACVGAQAMMQVRYHDTASTVSAFALFISMGAVWLSLRGCRPVWLRQFAAWDLILGGIVSSAAFGYFHSTNRPPWAVGVSQRVHVISMSAWLLALAIAGAQAMGARDREGEGVESGNI